MKDATVFISHSTPGKKDFLYAIHDGLKQEGFAVRLDEMGLDVGDGWRQKLFQWMDEVHAAVILLSRDALKSKFVPIELSILSFRHVREQRFPLLPVLTDELDASELQKGTIGDLQLSELQCITAQDPDTIVRKVADRLRQEWNSVGRFRTPLQILEDDASQKLRHFNDGQLQESAEVANLEVPVATRLRPLPVQFARAMIVARFSTACSALCALADRTTSSDARKRLLELLNLITPFWVKESEASYVARIALAEPERRAVSLACMEAWTVRNHICRASLKPLGTGWRVCELAPPEHEDELWWVQDQLVKVFTPPSGAARTTTIEDLGRKLSFLESNRRPLFLVFPPSWMPSRDTIAKLRRVLKTPVFFLIGEAEDLQLLQPEVHELMSVSRDDELYACDTYDDTLAQLAPTDS